jgi:signal transduction histidine kinase
MDHAVYQQIVHETMYGQILLDAAGRVCLWNRWMEDRSRRATEKVIGKPLSEAFGSRHQLSGRLLRVVGKSVDGSSFAGRSHAFAPHPLPLRDAENPRKWLIHSLTVRSIRASNGQRYCLLEVQDISDSHNRESLLRQMTQELRCHAVELESSNNELANKNRELDEFVYQVSHDLQEPLRKLLAFSDLLNEDLGDKLDEAVTQDIYYIRDSASRMSRMIEDLLRLSRAGNSMMQWVKVPLKDCVNEVLNTLSLCIQETGAEVLIDELPTIHGDPGLISQMLQNLSGNALKFVRDKIPRLHFTYELVGDEHVIGVRDNGIGIDSKYVHSIFTPFKRLHSRMEFKGNGIGLSICKTVVERHGGRIWVESEPGEGAHFRFTLASVRPFGVEESPGQAQAA